MEEETVTVVNKDGSINGKFTFKYYSISEDKLELIKYLIYRANTLDKNLFRMSMVGQKKKNLFFTIMTYVFTISFTGMVMLFPEVINNPIICEILSNTFKLILIILVACLILIPPMFLFDDLDHSIEIKSDLDRVIEIIRAIED